MTMSNPILVEVLRGVQVESRHRGAVAVVDGSGGAVPSLRAIDRPTLPPLAGAASAAARSEARRRRARVVPRGAAPGARPPPPKGHPRRGEARAGGPRAARPRPPGAPRPPPPADPSALGGGALCFRREA